MKSNYELTCLISSSLTEAEREKTIENTKNSITEKEGEISTAHPLNKVSLAYPIKEQDKAHMSIIDLKIEGDRIEELKRNLSEENGLLRFFLIKRDKKVSQKPIKEKRVSKVKIGDIDKKIEEILNPSKKDESE